MRKCWKHHTYSKLVGAVLAAQHIVAAKQPLSPRNLTNFKVCNNPDGIVQCKQETLLARNLIHVTAKRGFLDVHDGTPAMP